MYVHVFGGVSSGACSNYNLKMMSVESKDKFGEEPAQTFQGNCYVDDLWKSVEIESKVVQLLKVTEMCHEGAFILWIIRK